MQRWSLSNWVSPIKHPQFREILERYLTFCEEAFGTQCSAEIKARSQGLVYSTFSDPAIDDLLALENGPAAIYAPDMAGGLSPSGWRAARHVECVIRPKSGMASMKHAFAHVEFKGISPKQATFYVQCADGDVRSGMIAAFPGMRRGNGHAGNGVDAKLLPGTITGPSLPLPGYNSAPRL